MPPNEDVVIDDRKVPKHIVETVQVAHALRERQERSIHRHQRLIENVTGILGTPQATFGLALFVTIWILGNLLLWKAGHEVDPPPFVWLQGMIGLYVAFLANVVLATQSRQMREAERRAELDLQVGLLAEQKAAKIIALLEDLRRDMPTVANRADPSVDALKEATNAEVVLELLEDTEGLGKKDSSETALATPRSPPP